MDDTEWLATRFEDTRAHLCGVAYRMLGSLTEADDAVQEAWLRLSRADVGQVDNLTGWLTTVVARVSLDMLRSRNARREESLDARLPDLILGPDGPAPEDQAVLADSLGLALLVVLDTLTPAERVAFVLHDMFAVPFEEIASIVDRSPIAARQLASRARRRVRGAPVPDADLDRQREVVGAFLAAARDGDFDALVATLHPDVLVRAETGAPQPVELRGARSAAQRAMLFARYAEFARPILVNGAAGIIALSGGRPLSVMGFTVVAGQVVEIDILTSADRLRELDLTNLD
ncbi:sigma-70 family RNA polymerase sigma factor [[Mycobacterium] nativiensis]|uniref:Sigma-70 family RNA polymerase sigma factor n=1 Tax=[Mycobacterium] nativiensis TaxID=2855503 RepID=A0ABU5XZP5_9MYCO|nr:sigma-70 family RNA polymerase sigma factor [Mycolicibacter sp. MYC340]MEB3032901.1 sigma-70 family RNA polymerase sigma factor [Mycolicibacter sp. MYC340]